MKADMLKALAEYNNHANRILLNAASKLSAEVFANTPSPSRESAKNLLLHLIIVEAAYYARCRGRKFNFDSNADRTFDEIQKFADETAIELQRLMDSLSEDDLASQVTAKFGDQSLHLPLWQMLLHTFMHSARHRGELSIVLSQLGQPLPIPDLIVQFIDQSGQTWPFERE
ncbi:MAG: DinB family protein [Chloroflexi bacterium]|nr:DinB family protein [Chloroflexota bacterium]